MDRKQLYKEIASLHLQENIKAKFGKNYTQCSNAELQKAVDEATKAMTELTKPSRPAESKPCEKASIKGPVVVNRVGSVAKLVEILAKKKILLKSEVDAIMNV